MANEKEMVIDLKELLAFVLKKWLYFFVITVVCALVIGGYITVSVKKSKENQYSEEKKEALVNELTESEANEVENLFSSYIAYKNRIEYSETYLGTSVLMKLDPNHLPVYTVQYSIGSDHYNIISSFTSSTLGLTEYKEIADVFGYDTDASSISELVSVSGTSTDEDGYSVVLDNHNSVYVGNVKNDYKCMLNLTVYAYNKAQCIKIMQIVEKAIQSQYQNLLDFRHHKIDIQELFSYFYPLYFLDSPFLKYFLIK